MIWGCISTQGGADLAFKESTMDVPQTNLGSRETTRHKTQITFDAHVDSL